MGPVTSQGHYWLDGVPDDWNVKQTRRVCKLTTGGRDTQDAKDEGEYPFFVRSQTIERIDSFSFDGEGVLTSGDGAGVGKIFHHYVGKFDFHQRVYLYYDFKGVSPRFYFYYLREHLHLVVLAGNAKSTVDSLRRPMLMEFPVPVPTEPVQRRIVDFLDQKTAAIDALIAKKERLIGLLQEKRQALITQAVTKGLDPKVPMKDSGIEWLGEIPQHWKARRLKTVLSHFVDCPHSTPEYSADGEYPAIRTADVSEGVLSVNTARRVAHGVYLDRVRRLVPAEGDILYSREGERFAKAALVPPGVLLCLAQRMLHLRTDHMHSHDFVMWALNGDACTAQAKVDTVGATSPRVNIETVRNLWIAVPPLPEQADIAAAIWQEQKKSAGVISHLMRQIHLLSEYRQALISSVVTGQLDISQEVAKEVEEEVH